jgi:hypothetical protein
MGRWCTILGVVISIGTAYLVMQFKGIMDYVQALFSFFIAPLFGTVLLGMFWKRATKAGGFWGLLIGTLTSIGLWAWVKLDPSALRYVALSPDAKDMAENMYRALWSLWSTRRQALRRCSEASRRDRRRHRHAAELRRRARIADTCAWPPQRARAGPGHARRRRQDDHRHRRDSFCGKMSACNNLRQYGIPYSLTTLHTVAPDSPSSAPTSNGSPPSAASSTACASCASAPSARAPRRSTPSATARNC